MPNHLDNGLPFLHRTEAAGIASPPAGEERR